MAEARITFQNSRNLTLIGDLATVSPTHAVILSHGFMSDRNGRGRLPALAAALNAAGISTLRYDFAGCGESDDDILTPDGLRDDLHSAIRFLEQKGFRHIGLYGHSLGGTISIASYQPGIKALATTGAGTGAAHYRFEEFFPADALAEMERTGVLAAPGRSEHRTVIRASREMILAFNSFSADDLLNPINIPVLLIHGGGDDEERMLAAIAQKAIHRLPTGSELKIYPEAPHDMHAIWPQVTEKLVAWFSTHLG
ncbi:alpha/beta hydrolase [Terriglobus tenax]|uniref:alpha/beta hydrolase n=1 Tax=Terriglobus tenax TaxID=1111115 RepID=UPI0021E0C7B1|nr:alpha/beta hydrolase [Terriglobus tenax]